LQKNKATAASTSKSTTNYKVCDQGVGGPVIRVWNQGFASPVVSGLSPVIANMMATEGLHGY
jgi:hypothetical protein